MNRGADGRALLVGRIGMIGMTALFVIVLLRVAQLQIAPGARLAGHIDDRVASRSELAPRGDLLDRRGRVLAATRVGRRVFVDPVMFAQPYDRSIIALAEAIGVDVDDVGTRILTRIAENERREAEGLGPIRYVSIDGVLDAWRVDAVLALNLPGVHLERRSVREAPVGEATASLVGKVGVDHDGLLGAELAFDESLRPANGRLDYVHDARGRALWIEAGGYTAPAPGESLRLSVDLALQQIAMEELERGVREADAAGGRLLMVDPATGEILAMVDHVRHVPGVVKYVAEPGKRAPAPEPGVRYVVIPEDAGREIHPALGRNRCVEDAYEPGSTFKPFLWSVVTELGLAAPDEVINTEGGRWRTAYGRPIEDVVEKDEQTWSQVLINSSNIGMVKVCERLSYGQTQEAIRRFGFGTPSGLGLSGESAGLVTAPKHWTKYTQTSVSFGYEVAVSPLQMARAFCAFARPGDMAGTLPRLRLTAVGKQDAQETPVVHRVLPAQVAALAREAMKGVGENLDLRLRTGKGEGEAPFRYDIFGKSGTSKVARPGGRGYFDRQYCSSFIAGAPAAQPRVVVLVIIDDPGPERVRARTHYGSQVAGPVVRRVVERGLAYLGEAPTQTPEAPPARVAAAGE